MSTRILATLAVCLSATTLQSTYGESIALGKLAKQSSTYPGYPASRALKDAYSNAGSFTYYADPSWWEVDLRGYFDISNIILTAANNGWGVHMRNAYVEVMDKDVSLCSDAQVEWCGNVSSTVARKEKFIFTCNVTFPFRLIRVTRHSAANTRLSVGNIDVQGVGATKRYRSYYTTPTTESNCLLTYEVVPQNSVARNAWTMYTKDNCL